MKFKLNTNAKLFLRNSNSLLENKSFTIGQTFEIDRDTLIFDEAMSLFKAEQMMIIDDLDTKYPTYPIPENIVNATINFDYDQRAIDVPLKWGEILSEVAMRDEQMKLQVEANRAEIKNKTK